MSIAGIPHALPAPTTPDTTPHHAVLCRRTAHHTTPRAETLTTIDFSSGIVYSSQHYSDAWAILKSVEPNRPSIVLTDNKVCRLRPAHLFLRVATTAFKGSSPGNR